MTDTDTGSANAGNPAGSPPAGQTPWVDTLPEDLKGFALNKGWDSPDKVLVGYRQLEQFVGADKAGRAVVLPGENATPEELAEFSRRLGVPDTADAYAFAPPEGFPDPEFGKVGASLLHKHRIPKSQGEALLKEFGDIVMAGQAAQTAEETTRFAAEEAALKDAWGADFDKNTDIAKRGARKLGFTDEVIDALEAKSGFAGVLKALHQAGTMLGEGAFHDAGGTGGGPSGAETLEQLQSRRSALVKDRAWSQRYHANEPTARREYDDLNAKIARLTGA